MKLEYLLLFIIMFIAIFIFLYTVSEWTSCWNPPHIESMAMPPIIPGNSSQGIDISTITNLRSFLEQSYSITNKDENKDLSYNFCGKMSDLASWLGSTIGNIQRRSMEEIFATYGAISIPASDPNADVVPPTIPLISNYMDYIQLLSLSVRGSVLEPYNEHHVAIINKLNLNVKGYQKDVSNSDVSNGFVSYLNMGLIDSANAQYIPIKNILQHFHNQLLQKDQVYQGDGYDTTLMPDTKCDRYKPSLTLNYKKFNEFSTPNETSYGVVPFWAKKIRVLIIGAGGGGGGGAGGCHTRKRGNDDAGGGGAGGNTGMVIFTDMYNVAPKTQFSVNIGAGGSAGEVSTNANAGGITKFSIGSHYIIVNGSFGGGGGNGGQCRRYTGNAGIIKEVSSGFSVNGFSYQMKDPNWGTMGVRGNTNSWLWNTIGGQPGKGGNIRDFRDLSPSDLNELDYLITTYGYSGNGGSGVSGQYPSWIPLPGTNGGGGYIRVFFYE